MEMEMDLPPLIIEEEDIDPLLLLPDNYNDTSGGGYPIVINGSSSSANLTPSGSSNATLTFSLPLTITVHLLYNFIFISSVIGNLLVIYTVLSSKRMQTVANYLIANLALGDLLMALLCVPFSYISVLLQHWPFGLLLCHLVSPAQAICVFVSSYTLIVLAIDRYMAILYPLRPRMGKREVASVIGCVWGVAVLTALPIGVFTRLNVFEGVEMCEESGWTNEDLKLAYSLALMVLQYFFPIIVLLFTYTRISLVVWGKGSEESKNILGNNENNVMTGGGGSNGGLVREQRLARAKRKMIKMMILVCSIYTFCWFPFNILMILATTVSSFSTIPQDTLTYIYITTHILAISHTVVNPIVYCGMNSRFRQGFRQAVGRVLPQGVGRRMLCLHGNPGDNSNHYYTGNTTVVMSSRGRLNSSSTTMGTGSGRNHPLMIKGSTNTARSCNSNNSTRNNIRKVSRIGSGNEDESFI